MSDRSVWFVHPPFDDQTLLAPYRTELLRCLDEELGFRFVFVGLDRDRLHDVPSPGLRDWTVLPGRSMGPYRRGVGLGIAKAARSNAYDVWISSILNWYPTHACYPLVRAKRRPFLLWMEDWWWPDTFGAAGLRAYGRRILRGASALVVAGSKSRSFAIENGAEKDRVFIAPNATEDMGARPWDDEAVRRFRMETVGTTECLVFLFLNRIVPYKGLDLLLRAFRPVEAAHPDAWLVVCGDGSDRVGCEGLVRDLGLRNVRFRYQVPFEDVHIAYRACDLYVHPARFETRTRVRAEAWGFTINEAMSVGRPALATSAVASAHDLIEDGVNGYLVEAGSVDALTKRLFTAVEDRVRLEAMGEKARASAAEFTPARQASGFRVALESVGAR